MRNEPASIALTDMTAPKPQLEIIAAYIEVAGLKMSPVAALALAGVISAPIRCALATENLLTADRPPEIEGVIAGAAGKVAPVLASIAAAHAQSKLSRAPGAAPQDDMDVASVAKTMHSHLKGIRECAGVGCFAYDNWFFVSAHVSNAARGLELLREQLDWLNLLQFSEIAVIDFDANICRTFHPSDSTQPFERRVSLMLHYRNRGLGFLKGGDK
jgi:hypothetical protein